MKFSAKAGCKAATTSETTFAARQNTLVSFQWFGQDLESNVIKAQKSTNASGKGSLLISSLVFCALGLAAFLHTNNNMKQGQINGDMSVTLMDGNPDENPKLFHESIDDKNKMSVPNTMNGKASVAQPAEDLTALQTPPADIQSVKSGKSYNSTARSKLGSGIFKKLSTALSFKDSVSEKVNLEVKYVEKSVVPSQYEPPGQELNENSEGDAKTQLCDNVADQSSCDTNVEAAQLNSVPSKHNLLSLNNCSLEDQISVVRQSNLQEEPQNPVISMDASSSDAAPESQTLDLLSSNDHDVSRNEASFADNQSPMPQVLHPSNAHSPLLQPVTEEICPANEVENPSSKQESLDPRSGHTSKKSKSLKQYFKRIKPT
jgi:hypothetical protein